MTTEAGSPIPFARPRPGVVRALGILNIVFASLMLVYALGMMLYTAAALSVTAGLSSTTAVAEVPKAQPTPTPLINVNLFTAGWDDPKFVRFTIFDLATSFVLNLAMLGTGIGLLNLGPRSARWWAWAAWIKIVRLVLAWGYFIVEIAPTLSERMARAVAATMGSLHGRPISVTQLNQIYNYGNLFLALAIMFFGLIYPAVSIFTLGRPGVRAALVPSTSEGARVP